ncbi:MAG: CoA-binding protein [Spirochaetes bacterium]|nr:CoA-binding protein [Spirochaetota bacterium]
MQVENVVVLGASNNPDRYSNKAVKLLRDKGHKVFPVNPREEEIEGIVCSKNIYEITEKINTVTLYVNSAVLNENLDAIIKLSPGRVIMNPGTESQSAAERLEEAGISVVKACTLVLLSTGQF